MYAGNQVGILYVRANTRSVNYQLLWYIATTSLVMLATLFGSALLLGRLYRAVARAEERVGYLANYDRSEEHTSELQSLMRISYAVFCLKKKNKYYAPTS